MTEPVLNRRRLLGAGIAAGAAVVAGQAIATPAYAATTRLHDNTTQARQGLLYTGSVNHAGDDTASDSDCPASRIGAYWGGLYVYSYTSHQLRTGRFVGCGTRRPSGIADRMRWASFGSWTAAPEYRLAGRLYVVDIGPRDSEWAGLVFHPVHRSNLNNYFVKIWERDHPARVVFAKEVNDRETVIATAPMPVPVVRTWNDYRVDVIRAGNGTRVRFWWNGLLKLDAVDTARTYTGGPVGMRLDWFDTILDETRVYVP